MQIEFEEGYANGSVKKASKAYGWLLFAGYSIFCGVVGAVISAMVFGVGR